MWRHQGRHPGAGTLIAALFGVALVGAGASLATSIEIAVLAVVLELLHARYMPVIRAQAGLLAFAAVALITRGAPLAYFDPNGTTNPRDPIDTWYQLFHQSAWTLDPIRLYVGNVAGPTFATSLLAVAIGVAWLAYARRVSLVVLVAFLAGSLVTIYAFQWDIVFQLDSGPTWFVAGLLLADRRLLPDSWALRPMLGFAAGVFAPRGRRHGGGNEAAFPTGGTIHALGAVVGILYWAPPRTFHRRARTRRQRDGRGSRSPSGRDRTTGAAEQSRPSWRSRGSPDRRPESRRERPRPKLEPALSRVLTTRRWRRQARRPTNGRSRSWSPGRTSGGSDGPSRRSLPPDRPHAMSAAMSGG